MPSANSSPFFLPYQRRWIEDRSRLKIMEKSRQIGLSWATAYACVRRQAASGTQAVRTQSHLPTAPQGGTSKTTGNTNTSPTRKPAAPAPLLDTWVCSRDETQARLFLDDCRAFAKILNLGAHDLGDPLLQEGGRGNALSLAFGNGSAIHSLSSNADAQAGKRGTRVLDEFALHPDPRRLYAIAYPGITWGGQLEIISTHRGRHNFFNTLIEEIRHHGNPKGFSLHRVTLADALDQGLLTKLKTKLPPDDYRQEMDEGEYYDFIRSGCADPATFAQEYECQPADDDTAFLEWEWLESCEYAKSENWQWDGSIGDGSAHSAATDREFFLGVDIGREHDLTVFWLLERVADLLRTRAVRCLQSVPFAEQEAVLATFMAIPSLRRAAIDQSGLGRQFAERASARYGAHRIKPLTFTAAVKEQLAYPLRHALQERRLRIPADPQIRADLHSVRREPSEGSHIRLSAARSSHGHGDRFWALALALHAAEPGGRPGGNRPLHFQSITLSRR